MPVIAKSVCAQFGSGRHRCPASHPAGAALRLGGVPPPGQGAALQGGCRVLSRAVPNCARLVSAEPCRSSQATPRRVPAEPCRDKIYQLSRAGRAVPCYSKPCQPSCARPRQAVRCPAGPCRAEPCRAGASRAGPGGCRRMPGDAEPGRAMPG
ncbi:hypothetical protein LUU34_01296900 [Aix galericulata]|nr:hypothetical protein LUU34_01296900 [Aix galericulata]